MSHAATIAPLHEACRGFARTVTPPTSAPFTKPTNIRTTNQITYASFSIQQGVSPKALQVAMGHSDIRLTMDTYAGLFETDRQSAEIFAVEGDSTVTITIEDSGPGIALDRLERIFLPFERLDADQRDAPGSGLGMALALALTRAMGGDLTVMSTPAHGTTVRVMLPRSAGDAGES